MFSFLRRSTAGPGPCLGAHGVPGPGRWARLLTVGVLPGLVLSGCVSEALPRGVPERPNVLLISLDTVRRDAVGAYHGSDGPSDTPYLDRFARESVLFEQAYAPIPSTLPSHMTMFTGLSPDVHGIQRSDLRLADHVVTLPQRLAEAGWRTEGIVTNAWIKADYGFGRGFDRYQELPHGFLFAERVNHRAVEALDALPVGAPWFLFLHYLDAHSDPRRVGHTLPYFAPDRFREDTGIAADDPRFCDPQGRCATDFLLEADLARRAVQTEIVRDVRALYARGVRYLDTQLGTLFAALRKRGLYEDTMIIVLSDHGEEFREHGRFAHTQAFEPGVAVPLMIKMPGGAGAGRRVPDPVGHEALLPSLLELLQLPPVEDARAASFAGLVHGVARAEGAVLVRDKQRRRYGFRLGRYKLIRDFDAGTVALYDLNRDPSESRDLSTVRPAVTRDLEARLERRLRRDRRQAVVVRAAVPTVVPVLTAEEQQRLEAIGYVD